MYREPSIVPTYSPEQLSVSKRDAFYVMLFKMKDGFWLQDCLAEHFKPTQLQNHHRAAVLMHRLA